MKNLKGVVSNEDPYKSFRRDLLTNDKYKNNQSQPTGRGKDVDSIQRMNTGYSKNSQSHLDQFELSINQSDTQSMNRIGRRGNSMVTSQTNKILPGQN